MASLMAGKAAMGSACAPPLGSGMMPSITPKSTSALLVIFSASVACDACKSELRLRVYWVGC